MDNFSSLFYYLNFFVVFALFDLVHNVEAIFHLPYLLKASENRF